MCRWQYNAQAAPKVYQTRDCSMKYKLNNSYPFKNLYTNLIKDSWIINYTEYIEMASIDLTMKTF